VSRYDDIEEFWRAILSEEADEVMAAWRTLDAAERRDTEAHLLKMANPDEGYAEVQQVAARFALRTVHAQVS
jgi:hypothetical protein